MPSSTDNKRQTKNVELKALPNRLNSVYLQSNFYVIIRLSEKKTRATGISRTAVQRLRKCIQSNNALEVSHLTITTITAGLPRVINEEKATLINQLLKVAAARGFAVATTPLNIYFHVLHLMAAEDIEMKSRAISQFDSIERSTETCLKKELRTRNMQSWLPKAVTLTHSFPF